MNELEIAEILDLGDDRLLVRATHPAVAGQLEAYGWVSALTNHYEPSTYGEDGHRVPGATPRPMTAGEADAYLRGLFAWVIADQLPASHPAPVPLDLDALGVR